MNDRPNAREFDQTISSMRRSPARQIYVTSGLPSSLCLVLFQPINALEQALRTRAVELKQRLELGSFSFCLDEQTGSRAEEVLKASCFE